MKNKRVRGITLIALVITIIVLLILAGVTIATLTGENGILGRAQTARESTIVGTEKEQLNAAISSFWITGYTPEFIDENYQGLQTELDSIVGKGKAMVDTTSEAFRVTFSDTGHIYYVVLEYESREFVVKTEEEYMEWVMAQTTENLESLTPEQEENLNKGFKATINSQNGTIYILVGVDGIIDWGDGTYSRVKNASYGNLGKVASMNSNISAAIISPSIPIYHEYDEKNKTYHIKIYAGSILMNGSTALQEITDWGENGMTDVSFANCTNLTEIVPLKTNSFVRASFESVFENCTSLKQIPENFFENCDSISNVSYTFAGCTALTGNAIPLWEKENMSGEHCYQGCTNLANYDQIPDEWK